MPVTNPKITMALYIFGAIATIAGGITGYKSISYSVREVFKEKVHESVEMEIKSFKDSYDFLYRLHKSDSLALDNYIKSKESSFAIGLRIGDDGRLYYRAENRKDYAAYKDHEMSVLYNYPYYYYIDIDDNNQRKWCK